MEFEEVGNIGEIPLRGPAHDDYRTCAVCGGNCPPDDGFGSDGLGEPDRPVRGSTVIGELFSISATNSGHAALREAAIPVDSPVDVRLIPLAQSGDEQVGLLVEHESFHQVIPISEKRVRTCIDAESVALTQQYVDELAGQVTAAL